MNASVSASWIVRDAPPGNGLSRSQMFLDAAYAAPLASRWRHLMRGAPRGLTRVLGSPCCPIAPETGLLMQQLVGVTRARLIVALGTGRGVAAVWLADALRNTAGGRGDRALIGFERDAGAANQARQALRRAGISRYADIRIDDPALVLRELDTPLDMLLIENFDADAAELLRMLTPRLRSGAVLIAPRIEQRQRAMADYLAQVRAPDGLFRSLRLPLDGGIEWSVKR